MRKLSMFASVVALGSVLVACTSDNGGTLVGPSGSASASAIPSINIATCETQQGATPPAAAKGVDFGTQLKSPGVLSVGSDNAYPPFEEIKTGASTPSGFDVDLYTEVAKRLGLTVKSTTTDFDGLFTQSIPNGTYDIGVSAITIKEKRKQTVDFTVPYFQADLSIAINVEKTPTVASVDDLAGATLGAQSGTTGETCAKELVTQGKAKEVKSYSDTGLAFQDLLAGRVAAIVNDRPASQGFVEKNASVLKVVQIITTKEQYGFAISKSKPDLREAINKQLLEIMGDGTYATIYEKWFSTKPPFSVPLS